MNSNCFTPKYQVILVAIGLRGTKGSHPIRERDKENLFKHEISNSIKYMKFIHVCFYIFHASADVDEIEWDMNRTELCHNEIIFIVKMRRRRIAFTLLSPLRCNPTLGLNRNVGRMIVTSILLILFIHCLKFTGDR